MSSLLPRVLWVGSMIAAAMGGALSRTVPGEDVRFFVFALVIGGVGAMVASRVPTNPTGWILLAVGIWFLARAVAPGLLVAGGRPDVADWVRGWAWVPPQSVLVIVLPLIFPDGKPMSPRWRLMLVTGVVGAVAFTLYSAFGPGWSGVPNAYYLPLLSPFLLLLSLLALPALAGAMASVVVRFRRSSDAVRHQIKWVAYAFAMVFLTMFLFQARTQQMAAASTLIWSAQSFIAVAIGLAVIRYRLYDIDRLISRTVTYALLVGSLAAVFGAIAIGLPRLIRVPEENTFLVAGATLAVAALFNPLRRRVQALVDRRFNRARYDGQQEVERLAERIRDEVELEDLTDEMLDVVDRTMQPSGAAVWMRDEP
jgi:hypothetical protein